MIKFNENLSNGSHTHTHTHSVVTT